MRSSVTHMGRCMHVAMLLVALQTAAQTAEQNAAQTVTITFHEEAYVKGPKVTLGEIADIAGDNAGALSGIEVDSAAAPRNSRRIDSRMVLARMRAAGIETSAFEVKGAKLIRTTTLHREVSPEEMADSLRAYVDKNMPWDPLDSEVSIAPPAQGIVVPEGELEFRWRPSQDYRYLGTGSFRGSVLVNGDIKKTFLCSATVEAFGEVLIAVADIPRNAPLSLRYFRSEKRALSALRNAVVSPDTDLSGYAAAKTIRTGEVLSQRNVTPRVLVKRRQMVMVETQVGALKVHTQVRADADGAEGDIISCTNLTSNKRFQGVVRRDGVVVVP
ncbi:MAG: flagellar basal body P-ring formation protein FlgA [Nitrospiraceae bacterium]|nr:flagellar basal body P-ring formation protein FlgA [Nitrospiraceae bacterium]